MLSLEAHIMYAIPARGFNPRPVGISSPSFTVSADLHGLRA